MIISDKTICHLHNNKPLSIFSVATSIKRMTVTSSSNGEIKVWNEDFSQSCSIVNHSGSVLCVRFSVDNKYLVSSGDDNYVCVMKEDNRESGVSKKVEGGESSVATKNGDNSVDTLFDSGISSSCYKLFKKLKHHSSDVNSLAFSNQLLFTGGCDLKVNIYKIGNFDLFYSLKVKSPIKGITCDLHSNFLLIQHENKLVIYKIKISENSQKVVVFKTIDDIFYGTVIESFFSRLSWSPDGKYVGVGLCFNNKSDSVEILATGKFQSEFSLIGHVAPIEVVSFNPFVYRSIKGQIKSGCTVAEDESFPYYVVAVASQDKSISIWNSLNEKPFVLLKNVSHQPVLDMCWSNDGNILYFISYDGYLRRIDFKENELGEKISKENVEDIIPYEINRCEGSIGKDNGYKEIIRDVKKENRKEDSINKEESKEEKESIIKEEPTNISQDITSTIKKEEIVDKSLTKKRIKPFLIAPLEDKDTLQTQGVITSTKESFLAIFVSKKNNFYETKKVLPSITKCIDEYRIEVKNLSNLSSFCVWKDENIFYKIESELISHVCFNRKYLVIVSRIVGCKNEFKIFTDLKNKEEIRDNGSNSLRSNTLENNSLDIGNDYTTNTNVNLSSLNTDSVDSISSSVVIYSTVSGILLFPGIAVSEVVLCDCSENYLVVLSVDSIFKVWDLKKQKILIRDSLPFNGILVGLNLDKKYFLISKFEDKNLFVHFFYDRNMKCWMKLESSYNSIYSKSQNILMRGETDQTILDLEYKFSVSERVKSIEKMISITKKAVKVFLCTDSFNEWICEKYFYFFKCLCDFDRKKEAFSFLEEMRFNVKLEIWVVDMLERLKRYIYYS